MLIQVKEMKPFLAQVAGLSGTWLSLLTHNRTDRNTQIHVAKAYAEELVDKSARQQVREENNNPELFVWDSGVRHRPSKMKSIEGSFITKNKG